jgi:hypothetical protein
MRTTTQLPEPSNEHATCAWCRTQFDTIVQLIDHVERGHLPARCLRPVRQRGLHSSDLAEA